MGYLVATTGRLLLPEELERQALTVAEHRIAGRDGWFDPDTDHVDSLADLAAVAGVTLTREGDWLSVATDHTGDPKWSEQAEEFYRSLSDFVRQGEVHLRGEDGSTWSYSYSSRGLEQHGSSGWGGAGTPPAPVAPPAPAAPPAAEAAPEAAPPPAAEPPPAPVERPAEPIDDPGNPPEAEPPAEPGFIGYPGKQDRPGPPPSAQHPSQGVPQRPGGWDAGDDAPPASAGRVLAMSALLVVGVVLIIGLALLVAGI